MAGSSRPLPVARLFFVCLFVSYAHLSGSSSTTTHTYTHTNTRYSPASIRSPLQLLASLLRSVPAPYHLLVHFSRHKPSVSSVRARRGSGNDERTSYRGCGDRLSDLSDAEEVRHSEGKRFRWLVFRYLLDRSVILSYDHGSEESSEGGGRRREKQ